MQRKTSGLKKCMTIKLNLTNYGLIQSLIVMSMNDNQMIEKIVAKIEKLSELFGSISSWIILVLIFSTVYEVFQGICSIRQQFGHLKFHTWRWLYNFTRICFDTEAGAHQN